MNKKRILVIIMLGIFPFISDAKTNSLDIDQKLVGTWIGGNPNRSCGAMWWKIKRSSDGKYLLKLYKDAKRKIVFKTETGFWWVDGESFFIIAPLIMKNPDVYKYKLLGDTKVEMKSDKYDATAECKENYKFIDTKID